MTILDGKKVSNDIKNEIAAEVKKMKDAGEKVPHLAAVIVGDDGASLTYVGSKVRSCERVVSSLPWYVCLTQQVNWNY